MPGHSTAPQAEGKATGGTTEGPFQTHCLTHKKSPAGGLPTTVGAVVTVFVQAHRNSPAASSQVRACIHLDRNYHTVLHSLTKVSQIPNLPEHPTA